MASSGCSSVIRPGHLGRRCQADIELCNFRHCAPNWLMLLSIHFQSTCTHQHLWGFWFIEVYYTGSEHSHIIMISSLPIKAIKKQTRRVIIQFSCLLNVHITNFFNQKTPMLMIFCSSCCSSNHKENEWRITGKRALAIISTPLLRVTISSFLSHHQLS